MKIKLHIDERDTRCYKVSGSLDGKEFKGELKRELGYCNGEIEVLDGLDDLVPEEEEPEVPIVEKVTNEDAELRAKAKEAGIKSWHCKSIERLKEELGK